jgi:acid stress-induced BolA-like protein IbaG/YrbA
MNQIQEKLASLSSRFKKSLLQKKFDQIVFLDKEYTQTIKIHSNSKQSRINPRQCIALSPSLYWIRKRELPNIKNIFYARKIAKAIFEDLENQDITIKVLKGEGSSFYFIAIDTNIIETNIKKHLGINYTDNTFCTAQEIFSGIEKPIEINETQSLINIDGIIEKVPSVYLVDTIKKNLADTVRSNANRGFSTFSLQMKKDESISNLPSVYTFSSKILVASLLLLSISWLIESALYLKRSSKITSKIDELKETYKLPSTNIELESVLSRAKSIESTQNSIREVTKAINSLALPKNETLESIKISSSQVLFTIKTNRAEDIKSLLSKTIKIASVEKNGEMATYKVIIK